MQAIRSLLFFIGFGLSTVVLGILCLLTVVVPFAWRYRFIRSWNAFNAWWLETICNLHYTIEGKENIPSTPCVIVSNHQSTWETLTFNTIFPTVTWVVKRELYWVPIFGWGLALSEPIAINRRLGKQAVEQIKTIGIKRLAQGRNVLIFPEGTRVAPHETKKFKLGGFVLAHAAGADILPVAHNSGYFWARRQFVKKPGTIKVVIGRPISVKNKTVDQIIEEVSIWMQATRDRIE